MQLTTPAESRITAQRTIPKKKASRLSAIRVNVQRSWQLYLMLAIPLAWLFIFNYVPLWGIQIAFRDYRPNGGFAGIWDAKWIGWQNFDRFFNSYNFWPILRNTLVLNVYALVAGFPLPIVLALALNYVGQRWFKKSVQMVSYAPYFISTVVMVGLILQLLATTGMVNQLLGVVGIDPIPFMTKPAYWKSIYVWTGVWQTVGFGSVIYLAALAGVDPSLHEAAIIDGANKVQRIRDIDIPGILPVAAILLILNMGSLLSSGFEKVILMQNPLNKGTSEVIDSYVYNISLAAPIPQFGYATAIGLFKSVIGLVLLLSVNWLAKRMKAESLF